MKSLKAFDIELFRLIDGKQSFDYEINDAFFSFIEGSILEKGSLKANVLIDKSDRHLQTEYQIKGSVELTCDRSLELFDYPIEESYSLIFKFGDEYAEVSEDVVIIPRDLPKLNLAQYLYEFICLSIPMKKLHPKFQKENETESENEVTLIYRSEDKDDTTPNKDNEVIDPRWNALKKLKNN